MKKSNILFYNWNVVNSQVLVKNLKELGHNVIEYSHALITYEIDSTIMEEVIFLIHIEKIELIFSFNYIPMLSSIANSCNIPYYSWSEDSPAMTLYSPTRGNACNHIFLFDKEDVEKLKMQNCPNIIHMPLASDPVYFSPYLKNDPEYESDICFLGSLYNSSEYNFFSKANPYVTGFCNGLIEVQKELYGCNVLEQALSEEMANTILNLANAPVPEGYQLPPQAAAAFILERKVSAEERKNYLSKLGSLFNLTIHTGSPSLPEIRANYNPFAEYDTVMPKIFYNAKINLHFTPRHIHSGISLRVFDVLACQGFLMTNWQPEIAEYFEDGKELVMFSDSDDLCEKANFYLQNPNLRRKIAENGYRKICNEFTYKIALEKILVD